MNITLSDILRTLRDATRPEDVFGSLSDEPQVVLKQRYRRLAGQTHPDSHPHAKKEAEEAFKLLQTWHTKAQRKIKHGTYGQAVQIKIASSKHEYEGYDKPFKGDLCDLYPAWSDDQKVLLKITRHARNNDLLQAEAEHLRQIERELHADPLRAHFPTLLERFKIRDEAGVQRQTNVLAFENDYFTLADVMSAYPKGIHPADMAWMFNRILVALSIAHRLGIIHGALIPAHIMIRPRDHNGMLIDWCYSVKSGNKIKAISRPNEVYYPPEVFAKRAATPATDIYMAAACMVALLGGNPENGHLPESIPKPIRALLRTCLIHSPHRRAQDAWELFEAFGQILRRLYGTPKFRAFEMPRTD